MHMVRLQIGQEKVKESAEIERQKLQELADEVGRMCPLCVMRTPGLCAALRPQYGYQDSVTLGRASRNACRRQAQ